MTTFLEPIKKPQTTQVIWKTPMIAAILGSVAKGGDTASSDVDLIIVRDSVTYADAFAALEPISATLGRTVNPTVYSRLRRQPA
jgi:predicted nucleotidyltransferase